MIAMKSIKTKRRVKKYAKQQEAKNKNKTNKYSNIYRLVRVQRKLIINKKRFFVCIFAFNVNSFSFMLVYMQSFGFLH